MTLISRTLWCALSLALLIPAEVAAQRIRDVSEDLMHAVMPGADRFVEWGTDPTVMQAFSAGSGSECWWVSASTGA